MIERLKAGQNGDIYNYPAKAFEKIIEMDRRKAAGTYGHEADHIFYEEEDEEPEVEYVEMEEDDMEDFGLDGSFIDDATGDDKGKDDEVTADRKRSLEESGVVCEKKDAHDAKLKRKRSRVYVQVENDVVGERGTRVR
ncbi:hypothetical protein MKX01_012506 [Papaver californicum]|nr:hypothetical protein MKX01_012506 [Papaver californicum]